jgi:predicted Zn-dependent peptidase
MPVTRLPDLKHEVVHATLSNGLRVVLAPDRSVPVVGVAVLYDVGIRSEPEGRTGFAHLFEHLMFQGSATLGKMEHPKYVQSSGGVFNGSTHFDYTDYFEALPSNALERGLFLEADRMASPRLTDENLANQIAVVKEEIRVNVMNRPYGGFPWLELPGVMFDTYANAHNGYGSFVDLEDATIEDAAGFFDRYYAPVNAVLGVGGDFDPDEALALVEKQFARVKKRAKPKRPNFGEPVITTERRATTTDQHAPMPAVAIGYRVPDPVKLGNDFLAIVLLAELLSDGDSSRLQQRLVQRDGLVTDISAYVGEFGDPFDERDPTVLTISAHYPDRKSLEPILAGIDDELDRIVTDGLRTGELDRIRTRLVASLFREFDSVLNRTLSFAKFELIFGSAETVMELPSRFAGVDEADVRAAAATLRPNNRTVLELIPGAAQ